MKIGGVIVAGGRSARMGREKALIDLKGRPVIGWIIERVAPQVGPLAINVNGDAARYAAFCLPVIPDAMKVGTPLAGLHAALCWAETQGCDAVLTVPSDSPFLPSDLVERLGGDGPAVSASGGQTHYLTGFWPTALLPQLEAALANGRHSRESGAPAFAGVTDPGKVKSMNAMRMQDWVASCGARIVEWPAYPYDPFFNVNTPPDLAEAGRIAAGFMP